MSGPRRWVDDPEADAGLRELLRGAPPARSLDPVTRRRLATSVARASAVPAAAVGWLFVKSAAAALGVVLGAGAIAVSGGLLEQKRDSSLPAPSVPTPARAVPARLPSAAASAPPTPETSFVIAPKPASSAAFAPAPSESRGTLSAEALLLEQARREMRVEPAVALDIAAEHAQRFPRGQLAAERSLIQIEALHRLGRDREARALASSLVHGAGGGLYEERVHRLLDGEP